MCLIFTRFPLSLRAAAMCSKASYRVKTMDSLDYRDLVCVVSNSINAHFSSAIFRMECIKSSPYFHSFRMYINSMYVVIIYWLPLIITLIIISSHIIVLHFFVLNITVVIIPWLFCTGLPQSQWSLSLRSLCFRLYQPTAAFPICRHCDHLHRHRHHQHRYRRQPMIHIFCFPSVCLFVDLNIKIVFVHIYCVFIIFLLLLLTVIFFLQVWAWEKILHSLILRPAAPPTAVLLLSRSSCLSLPSSLQASVFISTNNGMSCFLLFRTLSGKPKFSIYHHLFLFCSHTRQKVVRFYEPLSRVEF